MLTLGLDAIYWKPIQSGTEHGTDRARVQTLTASPDDRFWRSKPCDPARVPLHGIILVGEDDADNVRTVAEFSTTAILRHVPVLAHIDRATLLHVCTERFGPEALA